MEEKTEEKTEVESPVSDAVKTHENGEKYMEMEIDEETYNIFFNQSAASLPYETREEYKIRRDLNNRGTLEKLKGRVEWSSMFQGTYNKEDEKFKKATAEIAKLKMEKDGTDEIKEKSIKTLK